ncbi:MULTISPECIES: hypothetical protein [Arenimonas]|uniref:Uncharacterized protein n=1 Tax=Arenimonas metalli CF5-1 TaxID=1384056 RepID=A0A091BUQ9_9GAMM|nr:MULTISPECIES: hypothetical protein [Arenimonas]KFN48080.1 hypothetical protein N787_06480 [Arenimonas metalli CF5-1]HEX4852831.1 hypothetical protein [Arenimonas sp.]
MRKHLGLLLLALVAAAGNVEASSQFSAQPAGGHASSSPTRASAAVNFRIVIRESISLGGQQQKSRPDAPPMIQSVSFENGREVVTLARP